LKDRFRVVKDFCEHPTDHSPTTHNEPTHELPHRATEPGRPIEPVVALEPTKRRAEGAPVGMRLSAGV
jgi:hypothetical protein